MSGADLSNIKKGDYVSLVKHGEGVTKVEVTAASKTIITIGELHPHVIDRDRFRRATGERVACESESGLVAWDRIKPIEQHKG